MEIKCGCARHSKAAGYIRANLAKAIEADEKPGLSELLLSLIEQIAKAVGHIPLDDAYTITRIPRRVWIGGLILENDNCDEFVKKSATLFEQHIFKSKKNGATTR